ncbi:helix-turn-helix domain-containing protein [Jiangella alba]|uniref:DNA binding domain-containing protein, excisionase family n=1 Tax=Jiangella alba TaxID=561176 RepID=A0A1H5MPI5_9ACTN|nr:helix-turn-helix domain-containing protein [Jiangella alba]SEE91295.1 DNA binding domain-containing protein, excisionase family [Jiangella alba]
MSSSRPTKNRAPDRRQLVSVEAFADHIDVHPRTVRRWITEGKLPGYKVGNRGGHGLWKVDMNDVDLVVQPIEPGE